MRKTLLVLVLIFSLPTYSGEYADQFKLDVLNYLLEQNKTPNKIIKYKDPNGNAAKAVLNPKLNTVKIVAEKLESGVSSDELLAQHKAILKNYVDAFNKYPGEYDLEYLDSLDQAVQNNLRGYINIEKVNDDATVDEVQKSVLNSMKPIHKMIGHVLINGLQQEISNKKFSQEFTPLAKDKLILFSNQTAQILDGHN